jgi:hypothetical protein
LQGPSYLLSACFKACPEFKAFEFDFTADSNLYFGCHLTADKIYFNSRWLYENYAIQTLGLPSDTGLDPLAYHTAKALFECALECTLDRLDPSGSIFTSREYRSKQQRRSAIEHRLIRYSLIGPFTASDGPKLEWGLETDFRKNDITFECHSAGCALQKMVIFSEDVNDKREFCKCQPGIRPQLEIKDPEELVATQNLPRGVDRVFFMAIPTDPKDIVWISREVEVFSGRQSPSRSVQEIPYTLGSQLHHFDFFSVAHNQWYDGRGSDGSQAIIGIVTPAQTDEGDDSQTISDTVTPMQTDESDESQTIIGTDEGDDHIAW